MSATEVVDRRWRLPRYGFPVADGADTMSIAELRAKHLNVTAGDVLLPALVIRESALANNVRVMSDFTRAHQAWLAPHAKTTMAPRVLQRQLDARAWGITVANVAQARVAWLAGAPRVLVANEVVGGPDIQWLARTLEAGFPSVIVQVDSAHAVAILNRHLSDAGTTGRQHVLIEIGHVGGRTGARGSDDVMATAAAVADARYLSLAGVATYEGVVGHDRAAATLVRIDEHLAGVRETTERLAEIGAFDGVERVLVSAGGTRFVDRVVTGLAPGSWGNTAVDLVVRAGCYVTYGHGAGPDDSPFGEDGPFGQLLPALQLWADVLSTPEPGLAIVGVGKRNVGERPNQLLPTHHADRTGAMVAVDGTIIVTGLDDQHAYLRHRDAGLRVGDRVAFGLQHPTTLDRWAVIPLIDDEGIIIDAVETFFS